MPVPLNPQGNQDSPPIIAKKEANPAFGPITEIRTKPFEFVVRVDDADAGDQLFARLFLPSGTSSRTSAGEVGPLPSAGETMNPNRRVATFQTLDYCTIYGISAPTTIWVVVSDLGFNSPDGDQTGGLTDEALWVLTCN